MTDQLTQIEAELAEGKANWPTVRSPSHLVRVQLANGSGPVQLKAGASSAHDALRAKLAAKWENGEGRYPNMIHPRGWSSYSYESEWWQREGVVMSEWRCALRVPIIFYDGIRDNDVRALGRHLAHWFAGSEAELAAAGMQLVLLRIPDFQERTDTVYGDEGQSLYRTAAVDEAGAIASFADGETNWESLALATMEAKAADQLAFRQSEHERIEQFKRERRRLQGVARRLRSQLAVAA